MNQLTKLQIIEETLAYYLVNERGMKEIYGVGGTCYYKHPDKESYCAVGRCLDKSTADYQVLISDEVSNSGGVSAHIRDSMFLPQYQGHMMSSFWSDLQSFHDCNSNWNVIKENNLFIQNELTIIGNQEYKVLLRNYTN